MCFVSHLSVNFFIFFILEKNTSGRKRKLTKKRNEEESLERKPKKRKLLPKNDNLEMPSTEDKKSLILFDEAEHVFENFDTGFFKAMNTLIQKARIPIVISVNGLSTQKKMPSIEKFFDILNSGKQNLQI